MLEDFGYNINWGVKPVLFTIGNYLVPSYSFFVFLALLAAILVYYNETRKSKELSENSFYIFMAALFGGVLGAKIPIWIINWRIILNNWPDLSFVLSGRTIVGGLIGGWIAVALTRHFLHIKERKGNIFVPSIAIAIFFGRLGCFLRGCCYGIATTLPWGVNFGDGIRRHPTQIYEAIFGLVFFLATVSLNKNKIKQGLLFQIFLVSYFIFRFFIEFIRLEPRVYFGLTLAQFVALFVIMYTVITILKGGVHERNQST